MIEEASSVHPFAVVSTKVDRFARSARDLLNTAHILKENKISLIMTMQPIDTSNAYGRAFFQILGVLAELESEMIKERTNAGKKRKNEEFKKEGLNWGAKKVKIDETMKKEIIKLWNNGHGSSMAKIAEQMGCSTTPIWKVIHDLR
jgi:DNA invertase Pin-like site-specific DNA recombinase